LRPRRPLRRSRRRSLRRSQCRFHLRIRCPFRTRRGGPDAVVNRFVSICLGATLVASCSKSPTQPPPVDPYPNGPTIVCPASVTVTSPNGQPTNVTYGSTTISGGAPPITETCTNPNQSAFPIGTTTVTCTATDARQRASSCSFQVTVQQPPKLSV